MSQNLWIKHKEKINLLCVKRLREGQKGRGQGIQWLMPEPPTPLALVLYLTCLIILTLPLLSKSFLHPDGTDGGSSGYLCHEHLEYTINLGQASHEKQTSRNPC